MRYLWIPLLFAAGVILGLYLEQRSASSLARDYDSVAQEYRDLMNNVKGALVSLQAELAACNEPRAWGESHDLKVVLNSELEVFPYSGETALNLPAEHLKPPPAVFGHQQGEKVPLFPADTLPMIQMVPRAEPCGEYPYFMEDYSVDEHGNEQVQLHPAWPVEWCQGRGP